MTLLRNPKSAGFYKDFPGRSTLEEATLCERHRAVRTDHKVVEHLHIDEGQRVLERLRERFVRAARFRNARRMVVSEYDGGSIVVEGAFHDFARKYTRLNASTAAGLL